MKRAVAVAALSSLAVAASPALASGLMPQSGAWKGSNGENAGEVSFRLATDAGGYALTSTRVLVTADCASDAYGTTREAAIRQKGIKVKLDASGKTLRGSRTVKHTVEGGRAVQTVTVAARFTSARRATIAVKVKYASKSRGGDTCRGRATITAKPK